MLGLERVARWDRRYSLGTQASTQIGGRHVPRRRFDVRVSHDVQSIAMLEGNKEKAEGAVQVFDTQGGARDKNDVKLAREPDR